MWNIGDLRHLDEHKENIVPWVCAVIAANLVMYHGRIAPNMILRQSSSKHVVIPWACPGIAANIMFPSGL